jgi:hypothetical protein
VIRFSAGLVVVAIGVLIVGGVTSKLSLVYVAIVVSAVALVVLVIGVALKRDEIFGDEPELAPADAGAGSGTSAGQSAGTGQVRGTDRCGTDRCGSVGHGTAGDGTARRLAHGQPGPGQPASGEPAVGATPPCLQPGVDARGRLCGGLADALTPASMVVRRSGQPDLDAQGTDVQATGGVKRAIGQGAPVWGRWNNVRFPPRVGEPGATAHGTGGGGAGRIGGCVAELV